MIRKSSKSIGWTKNYLSNKTIGIIGYNSLFSKNYVLNLCDNRYNILLGTRRYNDEWNTAIKDGWKPDINLYQIDEVTYKSDIIFYLLPKWEQKSLFHNILENMNENKLLCYEEIFDVNIKKNDINISQIKTGDTHFMLRYNFLHKYNIETNINLIKNINHDTNIFHNTIALGFAFGSDIIHVENPCWEFGYQNCG
jgi:hypothetical protein